MTLTPVFDEFKKRYDNGKAQIVTERIVSDLETPVSAYLKLAGRRQKCVFAGICRRR